MVREHNRRKIKKRVNEKEEQVGDIKEERRGKEGKMEQGGKKSEGRGRQREVDERGWDG